MKKKIEVKSLQKTYQALPVLKDISFTVEEGDILVLLGSSGVGKSTLLRCLNLLEVPDEGDMLINGLEFHFSSTVKKKLDRGQLVNLRRQVGIVFQQYHLWPHQTVLQNLIEAPCQVLKMSKNQAIEKATHLLNQMEILSKQDEYPDALSGGQQQRVAIARTLMMEPAIVLFDEPTSALDPRTINAFRELICKLVEKGMTIVIATHEINFAQEVSTKAIFLHQGRIVEEGETKAMFKSPKTQLFNDFIKLGDP